MHVVCFASWLCCPSTRSTLLPRSLDAFVDNLHGSVLLRQDCRRQCNLETAVNPASPDQTMNDEKDPIYSFFPDDEEPDLYAALGVTDKATVDEVGYEIYPSSPISRLTMYSQIKKAYRKLALQYHPDKVGASEENTQKFHQIGFAYTVLNDEKRRKKYDNTGRTDESMFDGEADWNAYFKELWSGEVNGQTLDEFRMEYKGT